MANHCNLCDTRRPEGGTQHLILNQGKLWVEFCKSCRDVEMKSKDGKTKTVYQLWLDTIGDQ